MTNRQGAKQFIADNFPDLAQYRLVSSRMFEAKDKEIYSDDWWFQFNLPRLEEAYYLIFAGSMDYKCSKFRIFKVPTEFLSANLNNLGVNEQGRVNMYIHIRSFEEIRKNAGVSFKRFVLN